MGKFRSKLWCKDIRGGKDAAHGTPAKFSGLIICTIPVTLTACRQASFWWRWGWDWTVLYLHCMQHRKVARWQTTSAVSATPVQEICKLKLLHSKLHCIEANVMNYSQEAHHKKWHLSQFKTASDSPNQFVLSRRKSLVIHQQSCLDAEFFEE